MVSADPRDTRTDKQRTRRTIPWNTWWGLVLSDNGVSPFYLHTLSPDPQIVVLKRSSRWYSAPQKELPRSMAFQEEWFLENRYGSALLIPPDLRIRMRGGDEGVTLTSVNVLKEFWGPPDGSGDLAGSVTFSKKNFITMPQNR
jgi:hypothetical protein